MSSRPTLLVVLAFSESLRFDGLAMVRTQGIYRIDGHRSRRFFAKEELAKGEDSLEFVWRGFLHARESVGEMFGGSDDPVGGCDSGDWHGVMLVTESVGETFGLGVCHDEADASIMLEGRADVPSIGGVETPGRSAGGLEVNEDFCARWRHWRSVKGK